MRLSDDKLRYERLLEFKKECHLEPLSHRPSLDNLLIAAGAIFITAYTWHLMHDFDSLFFKILLGIAGITVVLFFAICFIKDRYDRFLTFLALILAFSIFGPFFRDSDSSGLSGALDYICVSIELVALVSSFIHHKMKSRGKHKEFEDVSEFLKSMWADENNNYSECSVAFSLISHEGKFGHLPRYLSFRGFYISEETDIYKAFLFDDAVLVFDKPLTTFEMLDPSEFYIVRAHNSNDFADENFFYSNNDSQLKEEMELNVEDYNKYVAWKNRQMGFEQKEAVKEPEVKVEEINQSKTTRVLFSRKRN